MASIPDDETTIVFSVEDSEGFSCPLGVECLVLFGGHESRKKVGNGDDRDIIFARILFIFLH